VAPVPIVVLELESPSWLDFLGLGWSLDSVGGTVTVTVSGVPVLVLVPVPVQVLVLVVLES
jgi:hypothetical protein